MPRRDELRADAVNPVGLLQNDKEFNAPLFQRRYVWAKPELDRFWRTLDSLLDGEESTSFLGAIVLEDVSTGLAFDPGAYWVIDGQQRLTTIYLLLWAVVMVAFEKGREDFGREVVSKYLLNQGNRQKFKPKLRPTNRDLGQFNKILSSMPIATKPPVGFGEDHGKMLDAWNHMLREARRRVATDGADVLEKIARKGLEALSLVEIILSEDQDPHQVFDALNTAGVKLTNMDLIRNEVFKSFTDEPQKAEALYNTRWLQFETALGKNLDGYLFPFTLIHKPTITKSNVFATLQSRWKGCSPEQIITDLEQYLPAFQALAGGSMPEMSEELLEAVLRLRRMVVVSSVYPFAMRVLHAAFTGVLSEAEAAKNLNLIESFLVRRAFAGYEPTGLHAVFKDMWQSSQGNAAAFVTIIDENPTIEFPSDKKFADDIKTKPLYGRHLASYILRAYERELPGDKVPDDYSLNIDHVMPQTPTDAWLAVVTPEDHDELLHTWGNLVPLSQPLNLDKGQKTWDEVHDLLDTESIYKTTKKVVKDYAIWNAQSIKTRNESLASWALERWPKG